MHKLHRKGKGTTSQPWSLMGAVTGIMGCKISTAATKAQFFNFFYVSYFFGGAGWGRTLKFAQIAQEMNGEYKPTLVIAGGSNQNRRLYKMKRTYHGTFFYFLGGGRTLKFAQIAQEMKGDYKPTLVIDGSSNRNSRL